MTRMNWSATNSRRRIRDQGAETVKGAAFGGNRPPAAPAQPERPRADPRTARVTIPEPIIISKFWKSPRDRRQHVRVELSQYEGHPLVNVRVWQTGADGIDRPTIRGVALGIRKLPELARALAKAETKARELGLLDAQDGASEASEPSEATG